MKILSYNIKGLGGRVKCNMIKKLVVEEGVNMVCLQETKKEVMSRELCQ